MYFRLERICVHVGRQVCSKCKKLYYYIQSKNCKIHYKEDVKAQLNKRNVNSTSYAACKPDVMYLIT